MTVTELVVFVVKKKISSKCGSTSGLFCHLKSKHNLSLENKDQQCTSKKAKINLTICQCKERKSAKYCLSTGSYGWFFYPFYRQK